MRDAADDDRKPRRKRRHYTEPANERWPDWLRELWGPEPEGPRLRAEAIARDKARRDAV